MKRLFVFLVVAVVALYGIAAEAQCYACKQREVIVPLGQPCPELCRVKSWGWEYCETDTWLNHPEGSTTCSCMYWGPGCGLLASAGISFLSEASTCVSPQPLVLLE